MQIPRRFTQKDRGPYADIAFCAHAVTVETDAGREELSIEAPAHWKAPAVEALARNYLRRAGVAVRLKAAEEEGVPSWLWRSEPDAAAPEQEFAPERSARQLFHRLAGSWAYWGWALGYFDTEDDARAFYDETCHMLAMQMGAPNSPQWFNTGLHWAYGISGPAQGHFYFDAEQGRARKSRNAYERPQTHACFIQSVRDDLAGSGGIMDLWQREARTFKYGSGTGSNFSGLRGASEALSSGGVSSGLMRFLTVGDQAAGAVKSGGVRKSAKMIIVDIDHPDTGAFLNWKVEEGRKRAALLTGARVLRGYLPAIMEACQVGTGEERFTPSDNPALKKAIAAARAACIPETIIERAIAFARQGFAQVEIDALEEANEEALALSGVHSACAVRLPGRFLAAMRAGEDWPLVSRMDGEVTERADAAALWRQLGYALWSEGEPGLQFDTTINEWHTCPHAGRIRASNPGGEFLFLDDTACGLAALNLKAFLAGGAVDARALEHAARLWMVTLDISIAMAQFPSREVARRTSEFRPVGLGVANLGGLLAELGIAYDSGQGRAAAAAIASVVTGAAYAASAEMARELGAFSGYETQKAAMLRVLGNHRAAVRGAPEDFQELSAPPPCFDAAACPDAALAEAALRAWDTALLLGNRHGFRNAQVSCVAPTGTVGLAMGCETPGIAPAPAAAASAESVIAMAAAVQPFVSGGVAQRIVLPREASLEDCLRLAEQAWGLGLKACVLQRQGAAPGEMELSPEEEPAMRPARPALVAHRPAEPAHLPARKVAARRQLPPRRGGYTQSATLDGLAVRLRTGEYEDGALGEVELDIGGGDPAFRELARHFSAALSLALQYGAPLEDLAAAFSGARCGPAGEVRGHGRIGRAESVLDYLFADLAGSYLAGKADSLGAREVPAARGQGS